MPWYNAVGAGLKGLNTGIRTSNEEYRKKEEALKQQMLMKQLQQEMAQADIMNPKLAEAKDVEIAGNKLTNETTLAQLPGVRADTSVKVGTTDSRIRNSVNEADKTGYEANTEKLRNHLLNLAQPGAEMLAKETNANIADPTNVALRGQAYKATVSKPIDDRNLTRSQINENNAGAALKAAETKRAYANIANDATRANKTPQETLQSKLLKIREDTANTQLLGKLNILAANVGQPGYFDKYRDDPNALTKAVGDARKMAGTNKNVQRGIEKALDKYTETVNGKAPRGPDEEARRTVAWEKLTNAQSIGEFKDMMPIYGELFGEQELQAANRIAEHRQKNAARKQKMTENRDANKAVADMWSGQKDILPEVKAQKIRQALKPPAAAYSAEGEPNELTSGEMRDALINRQLQLADERARKGKAR